MRIFDGRAMRCSMISFNASFWMASNVSPATLRSDFAEPTEIPPLALIFNAGDTLADFVPGLVAEDITDLAFLVCEPPGPFTIVAGALLVFGWAMQPARYSQVLACLQIATAIAKHVRNVFT